ncbi:hypothetical protein F4809DRAFT_642174 [Biscogniauxia mediterranea]|nr:hypothetical protein F4809DRAFT_642174 [Biscogniauxia mediterranea]
MASLVRRPSRRAGAVVVDPAPSRRQPTTTKPSPKPLITLPSPTTSTTSSPSVPGWLSHPLRRLRWLYARIRAERHDRSSSALPLPDPFFFPPSSSSSSSSTPSSPTEPNHHHHDEASEWRPRSFREILGRKLLEAQQHASPSPSPPLPLAELLERAAENLFLLCWWAGEWACCAAAWWAFRALVPARWQGLAGAPWWWRGCVCAWWAEALVSRSYHYHYHYQHEQQNPCLRRVGAYVGRGDAVIVAAAGRRRKGDGGGGGGDYRWGDAVAGRLDDLVELTAVLGGISWCFVCFYLGAARARVLAYPRSVRRSAWRALGVVDVHQRCRLDIELLELD